MACELWALIAAKGSFPLPRIDALASTHAGGQYAQHDIWPEEERGRGDHLLHARERLGHRGVAQRGT